MIAINKLNSEESSKYNFLKVNEYRVSSKSFKNENY